MSPSGSASAMKALVHAAAKLHRAREPYLVATVVRVTGSSYRRPGARMLAARGRWVGGSVSGGCLERTILEKGWWLTRDGAALVTFDAQTDDATAVRGSEPLRAGDAPPPGLGCDGTVEVLLERIERPEPENDDRDADLARYPFLPFERCIRAQRRGALATVFRSELAGLKAGWRMAVWPDGGDGPSPDDSVGSRLRAAGLAAVASGKAALVEGQGRGGTYEAFVEPVLPPPRLFVFGARHDAVPLVQMAGLLGWEVLVWAPHAQFDLRERFVDADAVAAGNLPSMAVQIDGADRAAAIVMTHDYAIDRSCLAMLMGTRAQYIGMLGPRRRTDRMLAETRVSDVGDKRVHAPVGLALGAETPEEIALAIVAEVQSGLAGATAKPLREMTGPIHARDWAAG